VGLWVATGWYQRFAVDLIGSQGPSTAHALISVSFVGNLIGGTY
jgi:hypothetical protein